MTWSRAAAETPLYDLAIVGGGLVGCAIAFFAARSGLRVVVLEASTLNRGSSGSSAGNLHGQILSHVARRYVGSAQAERLTMIARVHLKAVEMWKALPDAIQSDARVAHTGGFMVAETTAGAQTLEAKVSYEKAAGLPSTLLSQAEVRRLFPMLGEPVLAAEHCAAEGFANALTAGPALARAARRLGASIEVYSPIRCIERTGNATTLIGDRKNWLASKVVIAAGWQSPSIDVSGAAEFAVDKEALQMHVTGAIGFEPPAVVQHIEGRLTVKRTQFGTWLIGGGWPSTVAPDGSLEVNWDSVVGNCVLAARIVPTLRSTPLLRTWPALSASVGERGVVIGWLDDAHTCALAVPGETGFTLAPLLGCYVAESMVRPGLLGAVADDGMTMLDSWNPEKSVAPEGTRRVVF